uniref:Cilia- and flagella-associated protein HOATZ n=1 Tax=Gasterosteus aculeatus aculeatus TaxID=481459 RepID=A0AAQ4P8D7_GASAC|nr:cilia- and flagella-associated protein HOATZ [Gasterosteus aculeatus aculeatus]
MSAPVATPVRGDLEPFFTVFDGSSPADASHARLLWSSLSLLPPLESRLVSADVRQRLPVSRPQRRSGGTGPEGAAPPPTPSSEPALRLEERRRYAAMADQRRETLARLRRQREQRLRREASGPRRRLCGERSTTPRGPAHSEADEELVKQLPSI